MTLFTVLVAYMLCEFLLKKVISRLNTVICLQTVISLICLIIGYICMLKGVSVKGVDKTLSVYILIQIGRMIHYYFVMDKIKKVFCGNTIMIFAGFIILLCGYKRGYISIVSNDIKIRYFLS